jgi:ABC-type oligopeptide transport system substrate-binding subunit
LSFYWTCASFFARNVHYCNPEFDALVAQADAELDPAKRLALYEEGGRLLVADAPVAFLLNPRSRYAVRPEITADALVGLWPGQASLLSLDIAR